MREVKLQDVCQVKMGEEALADGKVAKGLLSNLDWVSAMQPGGQEASQPASRILLLRKGKLIEG